jgi:hypothetical protein
MGSSLSVVTGGWSAGLRSTAALLVELLASTSAGCSFVYVKGPQPDVTPPPPCTTSNTNPTVDTVLASASVIALGVGAVVYAQGKKESSQCSGLVCLPVEEYAGVGAMVAGGIGTLVFTPSAIVGFNRTADCRAWVEANPQYAPPPVSSEQPSSLLCRHAAVPRRGCPAALLGRSPLGIELGRAQRGTALTSHLDAMAPALEAVRRHREAERPTSPRQ